MRLEFEPFLIDADPECTRAYYESASGIGCDCSGCRNYERAAAEFPQELLEFFRTLGVDPKKPAEVYVNGTQEDGRLWYGGFYHLRGALLRGKGGWRMVAADEMCQTSVWEPESCYPVSDSFRIAFVEDAALVDPNFPRPVLQMEIDASLPWLLEEENDYP